jgi:hypothetical protein
MAEQEKLETFLIRFPKGEEMRQKLKVQCATDKVDMNLKVLELIKQYLSKGK